MLSPRKLLCVGIPYLVVLVLTGCSPMRYKADADREAYCIIGQKAAGVEGMPGAFNIEAPLSPIRNASVESATRVITITDSLRIASESSWEYRRRMDSLFNQALSLSLERHRFDPIYFGTGSGTIDNDSFQKSLSGFFTLGFNRMLATGADLSVEMSTSLFRVISGGDPSELATSVLNIGLVQPLLRGAGAAVTLENLTQAERDMVYEIRDFARFRKTLTVGITRSYLALLGQVDQVENAHNNLMSLQTQQEITANRVLAGLSSPIEADQATQQVLEARDSWIRSQASYERALDTFKLELGAPADLRIQPNPGDLERIAARGVVRTTLLPEDAIKTALETRLDLKNLRDQVDDASRKIPISADLLKPGLDLVLKYSADSDVPKSVFDFADGEKQYSAGLDVDLPLDRKAERNIYRQAFLNLAAAQRDYDEACDRVRFEVRNAIRNLNLAVDRHGIQVSSLGLAEKRVERDSLFLQAGRAITRDVLESQAALLRAQNAVTTALIDYYGARLDLLLAMETLQVDNQGMWKEGYQDEWEYADK